MVEAGTSKSVSESARIISEDSGETEEAARNKIRRGLNEIGHDDQAESTTCNDEKKGGDTGDIKTIETAPLVEAEIKKGKPEREAAKVVAAKTGKPESSVRRTYQREKEKQKLEEAQTWTCTECNKTITKDNI